MNPPVYNLAKTQGAARLSSSPRRYRARTRSRFFTWRESPGGLHHATRTYLGRVENDTKTEEFMCHNCRNYLLYFFFFFFQSLARGDVCKAS